MKPIPFSKQQALAWTGGKSVGAASEIDFCGVSIDTRTVGHGELFVAIRGERHDAHGFVDTAVDAGATGLLVEEAWQAHRPARRDVAVIAVDDTTLALGALARGHRSGLAGTLVAITGSNGKTTTKEMCHAIFSVSGPCLKNRGNLNNEFGLPLTLLSRSAAHRTAVVELGMNHRGEIARLAAIARADVGVITNVGTAHIEHLGSREEIALEKGDLVASLGRDGVAVLNADDPLVAAQATRVAGRVLRFGRGSGADVTAEDVEFGAGGVYSFRLVAPDGHERVSVRGLADTTVVNALAAAAAAIAGGIPLADVAAGLAHHDHVPGRMACRKLESGAQVIDDTYNANPQSMRNAIESLARLKGQGRGIAVLGDMGELGDTAVAAHLDTGRIAAEHGTDYLFTIGPRAAGFAEGALDAGMDPKHIHVGESHEEVGRMISEMLRPEDWVLVKGSRSMRMERVIEALVGEEKH